MNQILFGDCRETMQQLIEQGIKVQTCVTSPPYFRLRDYGVDGQLGLEPTLDEYIQNMVEVFRLVRELLADDGTLWLNLGDSYSGTGRGMTKTGLNDGKNPKTAGMVLPRQDANETNLPAKNLMGVPWRVAFALQADGWILRQDIIWHKNNPMPESISDRCTKAHEYIFLLSKSPTYFFDANAIKEPCSTKTNPRFSKAARELGEVTRATGRRYDKGIIRNKSNASFESALLQVPEKRNKRSVWSVTTQGYKGAHFATFPPALIEPCILAGSRPDDIVFDPFMGSGTTAAVALQHERQYLGCELNPANEVLQKERLANVNKQSDLFCGVGL